MRISDWSSDVCSSDLRSVFALVKRGRKTFSCAALLHRTPWHHCLRTLGSGCAKSLNFRQEMSRTKSQAPALIRCSTLPRCHALQGPMRPGPRRRHLSIATRSEEHTSELQSLMRISYAVFCLKKKKNIPTLNINPY